MFTCRPYFSDVNAIIFLCPISCFNESLTEDPRVNRLEDSFYLWGSLCSSQLLADANFIVFLNKCDLTEKKLQNGILIKNHVPSYAERPNTTAAFVSCESSHLFYVYKYRDPDLQTLKRKLQINSSCLRTQIGTSIYLQHRSLYVLSPGTSFYHLLTIHIL
jgi:hypothetical protein